VDKALSYLEKNDLPPHWDRETLFGSITSNSDGQLSDSDVSLSQELVCVTCTNIVGFVKKVFNQINF